MITLKQIEDLGIVVDSQNGDQILAYCPFHEKETDTHKASLSINLRTGLHNCFSGCTHGTFQTLCRNLQVEMPDLVIEKKEDDEVLRKYKDEIQFKYKNINSEARAHSEFRDFIDSLPYAYDEPFLHSRGFNDESVTRWEIKRSKFGLSLPIITRQGVTTGILSRMYKGDHKYLYSKGFQRTIFGVNQYCYAPNSYVIIVEGALDCIWMHQCGYSNTVAALGVSITKQSMSELLSLHNKILLLFDNDEAGKEATNKYYPLLKNTFGMRVFLPNYSLYYGKDPNDMTKDQIDYLIDRMFEPKNETKKYLEVI